MEQLMQKLMMSKAIMDRHDTMKRGGGQSSNSTPEIQNFDMPQAKYNIPQEFLQEQTQQPYLSSIPKENTKPVGIPSVDAIKKSRLPDEIKRLMIEHPIEQPQQQSPTLSNELIEKASRLMRDKSNNYVPESAKPKSIPQIPSTNNTTDLKSIIRETIEEVLRENGLLVESTEKTNEQFTFKVGKHIFEGKLTKVKKIS